MSIESKIATVLIKCLWRKYPFLMKEVVIGHNKHLHANPRKKVAAEVSHAEG